MRKSVLNGNVFNIIGLVCRALKDAGEREKAQEFQDRALKVTSYDEILSMLDDYVVVE